MKRHYYDAYDPQCDDGEEDLYDALSTQIRDSLPEYLREDGRPWDVFEVVILAGVEIERRRMPDTMLRTERDAARAKADQLQRERDEARAIADDLAGALGALRRLQVKPPIGDIATAWWEAMAVALDALMKHAAHKEKR